MGNNAEDVSNKSPDYLVDIHRRLSCAQSDDFHHLSLSKGRDDLRQNFGDIKFVCMGGTASRMLTFANYMRDQLNISIPLGMELRNISKQSDRFSMYKLGPVLFANHGMGCPSLSILLNELLRLLFHAGCSMKDLTFFRIGTCGGLGVEPGTIVLTEESVDGLLRPEYRLFVLGKEVVQQTKCDANVNRELIDLANNLNQKIIAGKTLCAHDFYEGQGRTDGYFCDYKEEDKFAFLHKCKSAGVVNIEMESLCFAAMLGRAKVKYAIVCVALLDRLKNDQVSLSHATLDDFQQRPFRLVSRYIKENLKD